MEKILYLPQKYYLVLNDKFELFYRGIIKSYFPYQYYIKVSCLKGNPYPRYFTYTPKDNDEGEYELKIDLYDINNNLVDSATTILDVAKPKSPDKKVNILCIGDSLTGGGFWTAEGYRRFSKSNGAPEGLGFDNYLNMIGTCKKKINGVEVGYEGYGSWVWKSFCISDITSATSSVWIDVESHDKTDSDQHSVWINEGKKWVLETIEEKRLKFKRGDGNYNIYTRINGDFIHHENAKNIANIIPINSKFEIGNPFWNDAIDDIDFIDYCKRNNYDGIDFIYILLTWNNLGEANMTDFSIHEQYASKLIDKIHEQYPNCLIKCMGIQINSVTGGIAANYGAKGPYHDTLGTIQTAFNYNNWLEQFTLKSKYKGFVEYIDVKGQFDSEYNMPYIMLPVNARSSTTEVIGTNGVHPTIDGYNQIGDVFYRNLVHQFK